MGDKTGDKLGWETSQEGGRSIPAKLEDKMKDKQRPETREGQAQQGGRSIPGKADTLRKHGGPQQQTAWGERQAQGGEHSIPDRMAFPGTFGPCYGNEKHRTWREQKTPQKTLF